ncbi:SapC family protein [Nitrospirillum sp. BR 11163]|uniref:SapC family protein n=1 Tax=Nitrospirillum sp. BR 11163 TaxID=3104323 RepID=UPI002AFEA998|nr:SapC family protein [Nitrospirillum sp. BR 11163]MEA1673249.1 SapC family protein [Nitrospirillum sp. BR 11163]
MTNIAIVNAHAHRDLQVKAKASPAFDAKHFVAVIVAEFPLLAVQCPILLSKDAETGAFVCGAVLGFAQNENLFLTQDGWQGYRPLTLQRGPFYTVGEDLAIDLDDARVGTDAGEPLFSPNGEMTPYLRGIINAMQELRPGLERTKRFIETLMNLKLIEPIDISLSFDDGSQHELANLYTIDREALRALPDAAVLDLFRRGYMQLIYLMIASLKHVPLMAERKNKQLTAGLASAPAWG